MWLLPSRKGWLRAMHAGTHELWQTPMARKEINPFTAPVAARRADS
jgi:hypothetical protein